MDCNPMITIIVPVYNVEQYLVKCLNSLVHQTYKNYELILVDDGSTDESGNICESYAKTFSYIKCYHKTNGGLSDARNYAIPLIKGIYVTFVDADDYVDDNFLELLFVTIQKTNADIVILGHIDEDESGVPLINKEGKGSVKILDSSDTLKRMCYEKEFGTSACGKLYPKHLIQKFPYPKGMLYEDLATTYKMIGAVKKTAVVDEYPYHYIQRGGSIRNSTWKPAMLDILTAAEALLDYVTSNYPSIYKDAIYRYFFSANELYTHAMENCDYLKIILPVRNRLKYFLIEILKNNDAPNLQKVRCLMMVFFPTVYRTLWKIHENRKKGN